MSHAAEHAAPRPTNLPDGLVGIWVFLASEIMFFAGLLGGYIVLRLGASSYPDPSKTLGTAILAVNTFVLITSSVTMVLALSAAQRGDTPGMRRFLFATIALGATFLGIKVFDYTHLWHNGFTIRSGLFGNFYYTLTGFHGLHVLAGLIALASLVWQGRSGVTPRLAGRVEFTGLYWHFVDIVWIFLFVILCLV